MFPFAIFLFTAFLASANCYNEAIMYSIAQANCGGLDTSGQSGWMYAVKRVRNAPITCEQICDDNLMKLQDGLQDYQ